MPFTFPNKLFDMLQKEESSVIGWNQKGTAFRIFDLKRLEEEVLPKYFRHDRFASVKRQLNLYGFKFITKGEDKGYFFHPNFKKYDENNSKKLVRALTEKKEKNEESSSKAKTTADKSMSVDCPFLFNFDNGNDIFDNEEIDADDCCQFTSSSSSSTVVKEEVIQNTKQTSLPSSSLSMRLGFNSNFYPQKPSLGSNQLNSQNIDDFMYAFTFEENQYPSCYSSMEVIDRDCLEMEILNDILSL